MHDIPSRLSKTPLLNMHLHSVRNESHAILSSTLKQGSSITLTVASGSMKPALHKFDKVTVSRAGPDKFTPGDIVLFESNGDWGLHRLIAIRPVNGIITAFTRGDNTYKPDTPVAAEKLLGKVTSISRESKQVPIPIQELQQDDRLLLASFPSSGPTAQLPAPLLSAAADEDLLPLIEHSLDTSARENKPSYMALLARNTMFLDVLEEISAELEQVEFILLKGAYLATSIYASPGLRRFSDIDILVREESTASVRQILEKIGFSSQGENDPASGFLNSFIMRRSDSEPAIHVHWSLSNSIMPKYQQSSFNMQDVWNYSAETGKPWKILKTEHLIIHLCEHALRHSFDRLILIRDIAEVISKLGSEIDWKKLVSDSRTFGLNRQVYFSLLMTSRKTCVHVPPEVFSELYPELPGLFGRTFIRFALNGKRHPELCNLAYLDTMTSIGKKTSYILNALFPPKKVLSHAYGIPRDKIGAALYMQRLIRGIGHLGGMLTSLTRKQ